MVDYAYTPVTGKIKLLLDKIRSVGVPQKVTHSWLKTIGFTSSNDSSLIGILKFVDLIDGAGTPTSTWKEFRGSRYKIVLGEAIQKGYAELYSIYPDAHARSNTELSHVFSTSSSAGQQVISKTVATFKALVSEAEFEPPRNRDETVLHAGPLHTAPAQNSSHNTQNPRSPAAPALHIDIQIHISADSTPQQIDKIFESMAKHLYGREEK